MGDWVKETRLAMRDEQSRCGCVGIHFIVLLEKIFMMKREVYKFDYLLFLREN